MDHMISVANNQVLTELESQAQELTPLTTKAWKCCKAWEAPVSINDSSIFFFDPHLRTRSLMRETDRQTDINVRE